jgi:hypothetical protein
LIFRINPLSVESESILLGYHTLSNEWQDGILTTMLRKANRVGFSFKINFSSF